MSELKDHSARDHALLSASSAHRWLACPSSAVAAEAYPNEDTEFTREGTLAHEVAEWTAQQGLKNGWATEGGTEAHFEGNLDITVEMVDCALGYADYIQEQTRSDSAIVLLEQRVDFSPWVPEGFGTCDCIILQGDTMVVIDYKYGQGVPVSATANPQLRLYALGALNDYGFAFEAKNIEMHIYQPRINNVSVDKITAAELLEWAEKTVKPIAQKAIKGKGGYSAGAHCKFCPHAGRCRELTKTCTEFVETHDLRAAVPVLAPHEVAEVLAMMPLITLWVKKVHTQAMTTLLDGGEIPGYKVVEGKAGNRQWQDELQVAEKLKAEGFSEAVLYERKLLGITAMEKLVGKKKFTETLGDLVEKPAGKPVLVPESDKREAINSAAQAAADFKD